MSRLTLGLKSELRIRDYHPLWFDFPIDSTFLNLSHWPGPRSLATTNGVSFDVLSYRYLDVSVPCVCFLHPILFRCRYLYMMTRKLNCFLKKQLNLSSHQRWVAPFGNLRIKGYSHLPVAYRSVSRPSSPVHAKASTKCP